ncbi:riboflavin kinase [Blastocladiella emersonii ATCC 22665]|nr:riboflavin kinase [Blastocladiella emersonii ATCC 22665]
MTMSAPIPTDAATGRPLLVDAATPTAPYPVYARGNVETGFQRGSKQLGIPTANLPQAGADHIAASVGNHSGIYYGWASVGSSDTTYPMVMSVGWNPYFKNEKRTAEVHIIHEFESDFYGEDLRIVVCGYIRDEKNYTSLDDLILDIKTDIKVAETSLVRPAYAALRNDAFLKPSSVSA